MFENYSSNKGFISRIYEEKVEHIKGKERNPIKNGLQS
jgi:hypothetical protein